MSLFGSLARVAMYTVATLTLISGLSAQTKSPASDILELDKLKIIAAKERDFSLPLDATPTTGSRLGLANRDLPVSVSVVTQEVM